MKKLFIFSLTIMVLCIGVISISQAAYTYSSLPNVNYDFSTSQNYTGFHKGSGIFDSIYVHGDNGFLGIGKEYTKVKTVVKATPLFYSTAMSGIRKSGGSFVYKDYFPDSISDMQVNTTVDTGYATLDTTGNANAIIHDVRTFQASGDVAINSTQYYYSTVYIEDGLVVTGYNK